MMETFLNNLEKCVVDCLSDSKDFQNLRSYYYFKDYLLFSNIWLCQNVNVSRDKDKDKEKDKNKNGELLFKLIDTVVDKKLLKQKEFIWKNAENEKKLDNANWDKLCNFSMNDSSGTKKLRQDKICDGNPILPLETEKELWLMKINMYENDNYDVISQHNTNVYLTQLLSFSHLNNKYFQNRMSEIFDNRKKNIYFSQAPVKTYDRCLIKASTDYSQEKYPSCANILDFMRCSVTYDNSKLLVESLNSFIDKVKNNKISCIKSILRIKNGFNNILKWKSFKDANYCDIKLNCVYESPMRNRNKPSQIIEIQLLLKFLLKAKKIGHKYYGIKRRSLFIDSVSNFVYKNTLDYIQYKNKILTFVIDNNINQLCKQLFLKPNICASIFTTFRAGVYDVDIPLLFSIRRNIVRNKNNGKGKQYLKLFEIFLDYLLHFNDVFLSQTTINKDDDDDDKNNDQIFMTKYFNFKQGIETRNCPQELIPSILKLPYLDKGVCTML